MLSKSFLLSTLGYTICTFVLAIVWHLALFAETYEAIGYIGRAEPGFLLGLLSIMTQGAVLSYLYPKCKNGQHLMIAMGVFLWSCHVLAAAAKNQIAEVPLFFGIETIYLTVQFGLAYGIYSRIYSK